MAYGNEDGREGTSAKVDRPNPSEGAALGSARNRKMGQLRKETKEDKANEGYADAAVRARQSENERRHLAGDFEARRRKKQRERWEQRRGIGSSTAPTRKKLQHQSQLPIAPPPDQGTLENDLSC